MRILACLKTIADPDLVEFDVVEEELGSLYRSLDPRDEHVLEEAVRIREATGGEAIALSAGIPEVEDLLKQTLCFGADRAVRVWDERLEASDTWVRSGIIGKAAWEVGFDLILCGSMSSDLGSRSFATCLARHLDVGSVCGIVSVRFNRKGELEVLKRLERGMREEYPLVLPAVLGLDPHINTPRYVAPFSRTHLRGMRNEVETLVLENSLGLPERRVSTARLCQRRPRVKKGIDVSALSMQDRLRMMRGELGDKKRRFRGSPSDAAREVLKEIKETLEKRFPAV